MKKNLTISLNLKEDKEIRKFINGMIAEQVKSISRELIKTVVQEHINRAIEESINKKTSDVRYSIAKLYEKERLERYSELQSSIHEKANEITNEVLVNAKDDIKKVLSKIISDMVKKAISKKEINYEQGIARQSMGFRPNRSRNHQKKEEMRVLYVSLKPKLISLIEKGELKEIQLVINQLWTKRLIEDGDFVNYEIVVISQSHSSENKKADSLSRRSIGGG